MTSSLEWKVWTVLSNYLYNHHNQRAIPTQLGIALTHLCNIRCPYCMREKFKPPKGPMTLERIQAIMNRMPYIRGVCIMGLCEPFLNPETSSILRWLKDMGGYSLSFTTNGMVPLTDDMLDALLRVDDFVFSIDTSDPETFHFLRGGADLNRVMENLKRLIEYKHERGLSKLDNPPIHINSVVTSRNFNQIPGLIRMLEPYADDLKYLMIDPVTRPDYQDFEEPLMLQRNEFDKYIDEYRKVARSSPLKVLGFDYMLEPSANWGNCFLAWQSMFIEPNGDAYFCYNYEYVLGNVFEQDPLKIWNGPKARDFRKELLSADPPLKQCRSCNFARGGWQPHGIYYQTWEDVNP